MVTGESLEKFKLKTFLLLTESESDSNVASLYRKFLSIVPKPNPKKQMKNMLALAAAVALTSVTANAAYIVTADNDGTTQPVTSRVYGTSFTTNAPTILDKFAVYDFSGHEGAGWTSNNAKMVSLYSLSGGSYSQIATLSLPTAPATTINTLVGAEDFRVASFAGLGVLPVGTYFIGLSEVKPVGQQKFDGYVNTDSPVQQPAFGLASYSFNRLASSFTAVPSNFIPSDLVTFNGVGVIPSLVNVPEAGSSVMALALGAMVVRFRSRRA
jgi:hypothetical protein